MDTLGTESTVNKRLVLRHAAALLATALEGEAREQFLANAEDSMNRTYPAPSPTNMRAYLRSNTIA